MQQYDKEVIKKLIKHGFDLELISFEYDIPIEEVQKCKLELEIKNQPKQENRPIKEAVKERSPKKQRVNKKQENKSQEETVSKMEQMRIKYNSLFFSSKKSESNNIKTLSKEQEELIKSVVEEIEGIAKKMPELSIIEKRKNAMEILSKLTSIKEYPLTLEQAQKLYNILNQKEMNGLRSSRADKIDYMIVKEKAVLVKQLVEAIDILQSQTEEIEELEILEKKLTLNMQQYSQIGVGNLRSKIENKISRIRQGKATNVAKSNVKKDEEQSIKDIAKDIINGTLDVELATEIIAKEANKRMETKPKNKFAVTIEQEKRQILIQIKKVIMEGQLVYDIQNPETSIMQLSKLCGGELAQAINTVVENLISKKEYKIAKEICNKYASESKEIYSYIRILASNIKRAEISDMVMRGINTKMSEAEDIQYFYKIEETIRKEKIKTTSISLGKSEDGLRFITLADIWPGEKSKEQLR